MKLSELESGLKAEIQRALGLTEEQLKNFSVAAPPSHIQADLSLAWPIAAAKTLKRPPVQIAAEVQRALAGKYAAEVLPPGFVNLRLPDADLLAIVRGLVSDPAYFTDPARAAGSVNIEFVSANPTGPMHLASGRGATLGDSLARIMRFLGAKVCEEFYVNNMGRQVELLGQSLKARLRGAEPPDGGYKGAYLKEIAARLPKEAAGWSDGEFSSYAVAEILALHKADMKAFGVDFDRWFLESELHETGAPSKARETLKARGMTYEKDGAVWFGGSDEIDTEDKDRVLVKSDGRNTYFLNDIAYHLDKYDRGFTKVIDIWGADHHGYVPRMEAAVSALGKDRDTFKVIIHQMVLLKRGEETVKMSKREGDFVSLRELTEEVGADACRFFFAMRGPNTHLTFDVDLAKKKSNDNPVFYVQYVHARIHSIFGNAAEKGVDPARGFDAAKLVPNADERQLMLKLMWFPQVLETCARDFSPNHLTSYLMELAGLFHSFYAKHKVLDPAEPETTAFRLFLLGGVKFAIARGLFLLGVSAPEKM
ncbi:MAG: arginine--tRNA ligase [Elusimicrobia bacterium RIFOXYB2_FULL_62_6]|nr:MAG: arginine--tRNA ligase [Elusimicrobia bacterium RIFOXYB2_FULL_62_6]